MRNFWMGSFACCYEVAWSNGAWATIYWYTLFPKRNATSELAGGIQFRDFPVTTCTQTSYDCARIMRNFEMGSLANCYQEHSTNDIWYKIKWCTLFPKRKATSKNLRFFWGRVYIVGNYCENSIILENLPRPGTFCLVVHSAFLSPEIVWWECSIFIYFFLSRVYIEGTYCENSLILEYPKSMVKTLWREICISHGELLLFLC